MESGLQSEPRGCSRTYHQRQQVPPVSTLNQRIFTEQPQPAADYTLCNRLVFISLPWSNAEYQQIIGRLHRQGSRFKKVDVIVPIVVLREAKAGIWSWDDKRRRCIEYKQTLADAAIDGSIPQGRLPSKEELQRRSMEALKKWMSRAKIGTPPETT